MLTQETFSRADLIDILLPNGQTLHVAGHTNTDIVFTGSQGPRNPVTTAASGAGQTWVNPAGLTNTTSGYATVTLTAVTSPTSQNLTGTNFGFTVPTTIGSVIGVQVSCLASSTKSGADINPSLTAQLIVGGSPIGLVETFALPGLPEFYFPTAVNAPTLIVSNLLYPNTLTAAQVNASNFGIQIQATCSGTSGVTSTVGIENLQVTIAWQGGTGTTTYYASQYGTWYREAFKNEASFRMQSQSMNLIGLIPETLLYPGTNTSMMQVLNQGLLATSKVNIQTLFWPQGSPYTVGLNMGTMQLTVGQIGGVKQTGRSKVTCEVFDLLYILNRPCPPFQIQTQCRHSLFDPSCTLAIGTFQSSNSVATNSTSTSINLSSTPPAYPYALGYIKFTSGQNSGLSISIKSTSVIAGVTNLQMLKPIPFPINTGDTLTLVPGCDKTLATCSGTYNNLIHFGGMPFCPNPEIAS